MNSELDFLKRDSQLIGQRYRLLRKIGEGSWSYVYLARDEKRKGTPFAVKILKASAISDQDTVTRFQKEIQLTQQLDHHNIVRIFSSGFTEEGSLYLVTEYSDVGDLGDFLCTLSPKKLPFLRALNILRFIARGLAHAHQRKIVHRDIKPENILLSTSLNIKIADFGIARSLRFASHATQGEAIGTPRYMAPEQFDGADVGPWSDVYSVGILAYELLQGELPFDDESNERLMYQHCNTPMPELVVTGSGIPCWMEDIVYRSSEKDPARRFQNGAELSEQLEECLAMELAQKRGLAKIFYFLRQNGTFCNYLTERGVSRKTTTKISYLAVIILVLLLMIGTILFYR